MSEPLSREQLEFLEEQTRVAKAIDQLDSDRIVANVLKTCATALYYEARCAELERERDREHGNADRMQARWHEAEAHVARLTAALGVAEAYIPARDYEDYRGDVDALAASPAQPEEEK